MLYSENQFRKQNVDPLYINAIQGHSGEIIQHNFLSQLILELGRAKELHHIVYAKYEKAIKERGLVPGFGQNKGPQAAHFTLVSPLDKNLNKQYKAHKHFYVSPRRDLRCGRGRRAEEESQVRPNAHSMAALSVSTRSPWSTSRKPSASGTEQKLKTGLTVQLCAYRRKGRW